MTLTERIEKRIVELNKLVAEHDEDARHWKAMRQDHRVEEHLAKARGYSQAKLELVRLIVGEESEAAE